MPAGRSSLDLERRKQALRKRLALDFQPLRDTLTKGLDLLVDVRTNVSAGSVVVNEGMTDLGVVTQARGSSILHCDRGGLFATRSLQ